MDMKPESHRFSRTGKPPLTPEQDVIGDGDNEPGKWVIHESTYWDYLEDIGRVQTDKFEILDRLKLKDEPIVIDLLSGPAAVRSIGKYLRPKSFRGLAVGFHDPRTPEKAERDTREGITFLSGTLNDPATWEKIDEWLKGDKADFVMSRGAGGLKFLPTNLGFTSKAIEKIWETLNSTDGTTILQIPPAKSLQVNGIPVNKWVQKLDSAGVSHRYVDSYEAKTDGYVPYGLLRLDRRPGVNLPSPVVLGQNSQKTA